ncbi:RNA methyltransferase [Litoribacter alkaliphilus]|uniref:RNA methyltransferase n=1 Tax=Litoribacter ruber TaxID=702568 RepID=A0AAP2CGC2_9BACT|nr:RNA methyltransferase [Litoribacter alkaliphilus]MBS9523562.1 RNA methyltransferase [Litoribacter alkaliphilus]
MKKLSMDELNRLSVEEYKQKDKTPLVLVLDNVRSLNNVGSSFRTADAFRLEKIMLCGITGTPPHREIQKTALGATESVDWEHLPSTLEAVEKLKQEGYQILAIEQVDKSQMLHEFQPEDGQKYAMVFGNEVFGVEQEVIQASDRVIEIPQLGTKHSLNISVTMGIVIWDLVSKMGVLGK